MIGGIILVVIGFILFEVSFSWDLKNLGSLNLNLIQDYGPPITIICAGAMILIGINKIF